MAKRLISLILAALFVLGAAGCDAMLNSDFESVTEHTETVSDAATDNSIPKVSDYDGLKSAVLGIISNCTTSGKIRFDEYDGDPERDTLAVCMEVANDTPLGAYAVYYINSTVSKIVSYYMAEITITYKKTPKQITSVIEGNSMDIFETKLRDALNGRREFLAFDTALDGIDGEYISRTVSSIYHQSEVFATLKPETSVSIYPEGGQERIVEVKLEYPFSDNEMDDMDKELYTAIAEINAEAASANTAEAMLSLFTYLTSNVAHCARENASTLENSAYGALVGKRASDEGMAMAFKFLCNRLGYECCVVDGRMNSIDHCWNMVKIGDAHYHVDAFECVIRGPESTFLCSDEQMSEEYWWEADQYSVCNGSLSYSAVAGSAE